MSQAEQSSFNTALDIEPNELMNSRGAEEPNIVGGTMAPYEKYPEFALIFDWREATDEQLAGYYLKCGGTLIAENKILTAAHCVDDLVANSLFVIPGFYSALPIDGVPLTSADFIQVTQIDMHPRFSINTITGVAKFDVAVLTLEQESDAPLALLYGGSREFVDHKSTVIGMGAMGETSETPVHTLREVNLPIISNLVCSRAYSDLGNVITSEMLCAGISKGGQGPCIGDSGGPLWTNHKGKRIQVGIVSFSRGCARANNYSVYARISELIDFIREHASVITMIDAVPTAVLTDLLLTD